MFWTFDLPIDIWITKYYNSSDIVDIWSGKPILLWTFDLENLYIGFPSQISTINFATKCR